MALSPSVRIFALLSLLLPVMIIAGGCMFILPFIRIGPPSYSIPIVADDASYYQPPDAFFWQWFPRVAERDPKTGETLLVARSRQPDMPLLIGDLRKRLKADPDATPQAYFKEHGMSCRPEDRLTRCDYVMGASFVCRYILNDKPQPTDYATRYTGRVRIIVRLSSGQRRDVGLREV